ncbi:hypothetical protein D3C83_267410 [compost metagenome]
MTSMDHRRTLLVLAEDTAVVNQISARLMNSENRYVSTFEHCFQSEIYPWCIEAYRYE